LNMSRLKNPQLMQTVLDVMPAFSEVATGQQAESDSGSDGDFSDHEEAKTKPKAAQPPVQQTAYQPPISQPPGQSNGMPISTPPFIPRQPPEMLRTPPTPTNVIPIIPDTPSEAPELVPKKSKPTAEHVLYMFKMLCVNAEGVLYEDGVVQVGLKSEYQRGVGRLTLFYGNMMNAPITQFTVIITPVNYLGVQVQEIPSQIDPLQQQQQLLSVACLTEFQDALSMQVGFLANGKSHNVSLRLPVVLTKFIEPTIQTGTEFFGIWKKFAGAPFEHQSIFKASKPIDLSAIGYLLSSGFHSAVLEKVDPNTNNLVACGTLYTTSKQVPVLLRLETNPEANVIRLTLRTSNGQVTASIKNLISAQLMN